MRHPSLSCLCPTLAARSLDATFLGEDDGDDDPRACHPFCRFACRSACSLHLLAATLIAVAVADVASRGIDKREPQLRSASPAAQCALVRSERERERDADQETAPSDGDDDDDVLLLMLRRRSRGRRWKQH